MAIAIRQEIIIIDPNEEVFYEGSGIKDVLERHTDWIVIGGDEHPMVFDWDDALAVNSEDCTFTQAFHELTMIGRTPYEEELIR